MFLAKNLWVGGKYEMTHENLREIHRLLINILDTFYVLYEGFLDYLLYVSGNI